MSSAVNHPKDKRKTPSAAASRTNNNNEASSVGADAMSSATTTPQQTKSNLPNAKDPPSVQQQQQQQRSHASSRHPQTTTTQKPPAVSVMPADATAKSNLGNSQSSTTPATDATVSVASKAAAAAATTTTTTPPAINQDTTLGSSKPPPSSDATTAAPATSEPWAGSKRPRESSGTKTPSKNNHDNNTESLSSQTKAQSKNKRKQQKPRQLLDPDSDEEYNNLLQEEEGGDVRWHPESKWREPLVASTAVGGGGPKDCGLTLYERNRHPRVLQGAQVDQTPATTKRSGKAGGVQQQQQHSPKIRITCDYQNLLDEFRCVICFGTLKRPKIVRECLHRFCESCMETCLRRMSNSCPVCRTVVPSRRALCVDEVYQTLLESIGLGESDDEEEEQHNLHRLDEAIAIAASLHEANQQQQQQREEDTLANQSLIQAAITKKRRMEEERRRGEGGDASSSQQPPQAATNDNSPNGSPAQQRSPVAPLVALHLSPHPSEAGSLSPLTMPFLRVAGDATVHVLEQFVQQKLDLAIGPNNPPPLYNNNHETHSPLYFSSAHSVGRKTVLPRSLQLQELLPLSHSKVGTAAGEGVEGGTGSTTKRDNTVTLFYRRNKSLRK